MNQALSLVRRLYTNRNTWVSRADACAHLGFPDDEYGWKRLSLVVSDARKQIRLMRFTVKGVPMSEWEISRNPESDWALMLSDTEKAGLVFDYMEPTTETRLETMAHSEQIALTNAVRTAAVDLILEHQIKLDAVEAAIRSFRHAEQRAAQLRQAQAAQHQAAVPAGNTVP